MTAISPHLLTADEFAALPREGLRLELVRGEISARPPAFGWHGRTAMRLSIMSEVGEKVQMWLDAGVRLIWVAHPVQRTIEVYRPGVTVLTLGEGDSLDGYDVVPGFTAPVSQVLG